MNLRFISAVPSLLLASLSGRAEEVWPGRDWAPAEPAEVGLDAEKLALAGAYAEKHGGGSGCIIRHGRLVKEWGSPTALADIKGHWRLFPGLGAGPRPRRLLWVRAGGLRIEAPRIG